MVYNPQKRGRIISVIILILLVIFLVWILKEGSSSPKPVPAGTVTVIPNVSDVSSVSDASDVPNSAIVKIPEVIATGLSIPWDIAFLPDGSLLVTERAGNLIRIENENSLGTGGVHVSHEDGVHAEKTSIKLPRAVPKGEGGLLGVTLHPEFAQNNLLYIYMTTQSSTDGTKNAVFRYQYKDGKLSDEKTIISRIPGAIYHDGGRMEFGPDGLLYITTGDAQNSSIAQDLNSLGGKILRLTADGAIPSDNPFGTAVYSYGHRNPQGLAWDNTGNLWETEHGRSGITSGMDEVNLIQKGKNYGWPDIEGDKTKEGMVVPVLNSGAKSTWAPASAAYVVTQLVSGNGSGTKSSLFFGGLKGEALYEAVLEGTKVKELKSHFHETYGRIRTVRLGPDGMLYLTTSNRDGRGNPVSDDDQIIRVDPRSL